MIDHVGSEWRHLVRIIDATKVSLRSSRRSTYVVVAVQDVVYEDVPLAEDDCPLALIVGNSVPRNDYAGRV